MNNNEKKDPENGNIKPRSDTIARRYIDGIPAGEEFLFIRKIGGEAK